MLCIERRAEGVTETGFRSPSEATPPPSCFRAPSMHLTSREARMPWGYAGCSGSRQTSWQELR